MPHASCHDEYQRVYLRAMPDFDMLENPVCLFTPEDSFSLWDYT